MGLPSLATLQSIFNPSPHHLSLILLPSNFSFHFCCLIISSFILFYFLFFSFFNQRIYAALAVVDNWDFSTYSRVKGSNGGEGAGGGAPRQSWAPPLTGER